MALFFNFAATITLCTSQDVPVHLLFAVSSSHPMYYCIYPTYCIIVTFISLLTLLYTSPLHDLSMQV